MKNKYIKPKIEIIEYRLENGYMLSGQPQESEFIGCGCGCAGSDIYAGYCTCNNGNGCPGCVYE